MRNKMSKKILFLDIDGTLTEPKSGATFKQNPDDMKLCEGVEKGINYYYSRGWFLLGISNQGGCTAINKETGKPYKSIEDAIKEFQNTLNLLPQLECIYFCPDFKGYSCYKISRDKNQKYDNSPKESLVPYANYDSTVDGYEWRLDDEDNFRKPGFGMITLARQEFNLFDCDDTWLIGDRDEDKNAAENAGISFMWADKWGTRFTSGMQQIEVTPKELDFLEGVKL